MSASEQAVGRPAIEVVAKAKRRQFTSEYKRKIVREADGCKTPGAIGALLRREGLYSSVPLPVSWTREGDIKIAPPSSIVDPDATVQSGFIGHPTIAAARAATGVCWPSRSMSHWVL